MPAFLSWYLLLILLGWLTFPLVYRLFPAFSERGYTLSRAAGLLIWGYVFWLFASLGIAQNDAGGILLALAVLIGLSAWALGGRQTEIVNWVKSNLRVIITTEILFFTAFGFLAFIRAANPELTSAEKPMELAFINAILRSPAFPPRDPWLSGYAISYYYFGYVMTAMLARLTSVPGSMAHNLMTALIFGLGAIGSYGILHNLLASYQSNRRPLSTDESPAVHRPSSALPLLAPLFLLLVSNFEGFLEVLHRRGILPLSFWKWLDMKELTAAPPQPLAWIPDRYLWWWRASRVIQDYDLMNNHQEIIDEFPFFSFLHADLHPHVLAIPFGLLAIAVALHLFLGGWRGAVNLFGARLHVNAAGFLFSALVLGGLAFLNTWDILIAAALIVLAYVLARVLEDGWRWNRIEDALLLGLPLGAVSLLLYLPFYIGFSSQAGGVLPNLINPARGAHLWVMFGPLFIPLYAYLLYLWRAEKTPANWQRGFVYGLGFAFFLWLFSLLLGWVATITDPDFVAQYLASQGTPTVSAFFFEATLRRLSYIGSLVSLLAVLVPALAFLLIDHSPQAAHRETIRRPSTVIFTLLLIALGAVLVIAPESLYLKDQFGWRINTIFKFYYQAWMLWSLAAAFGTAILLQNLRGFWNVSFRVVFGIVLVLALTYPVLSLLYKTDNFQPPFGYTLDDFDRVKRENPDEAAAIEWLRTAPDGVVAEAIGGSYSGYARISTYTGLPTVLGWPGHESQWRGGAEEQGTRNDDIVMLYTTPNWGIANEIIRKYDIRYVYVGPLELSSMRVQLEKFNAHLRVVFQQGSVVIYEAPR